MLGQHSVVLVGGYKLLFATPFWVVALFLDFFVIDILFIGREKFEGYPYNISWSSQYGDRALIGCILLGDCVLQQKGMPPALGGSYSTICLIVGVSAGLIDSVVVLWRDHWKFGTNMDTYHNIVIVSLLVYILGLTVPVIFMAGTLSEKLAAVVLSLIWVATFVYDVKTGRINQPKWHHDNGFSAFLVKGS